MNVSKHITLEEATDSPTAKRIKTNNTPNEVELSAMKLVAEKCFEPLREWYGKPIRINSFFRDEKLNAAVGSKPTSQHRKGEAIDMSGGSKEENEKIFNWCKENLDFDQLINEYDYSWVHISYKLTGNRNKLTVIV